MVNAQQLGGRAPLLPLRNQWSHTDLERLSILFPEPSHNFNNKTTIISCILQLHVRIPERYILVATHLWMSSVCDAQDDQCNSMLTIFEYGLLRLVLKHGKVVQQGEHVLWRILDAKQRLKTWQDHSSKLICREPCGDSEYVG